MYDFLLILHNERAKTYMQIILMVFLKKKNIPRGKWEHDLSS